MAPFFIWGIAILFYLYEFFLGVFPGTIASFLMKAYQLTPEQFSLMTSGYYMIYAAMQIPVGYFASRFGLKKTLLLATLSCTLGMLGFYLSHDFVTLFISRALMGFGASFGFIVNLLVILQWFPNKKFGFYTGVTQFLGAIGPLFAGGPLSLYFQNRTDNPMQFCLLLVAVGIALVILEGLFFKEKEADEESTLVFLNPRTSLQKGFFQLLKNPQFFFIMFFGGLIYASVPLIGAYWGTSFLVIKEIPVSLAAFITSLIWLGWAFGCPFLGKVSEKTHRRKPVLVISSFIGMIVSLLYLVPGIQSIAILMMITTLIGIAGASQSISFVMISELAPKKSYGMALGFNNMMIMLFASLSPLITGSIIHKQGSEIAEGSFIVGLTLVPIYFFVAFILSLLIKETFCRHQDAVHKLNIDKKIGKFNRIVKNAG